MIPSPLATVAAATDAQRTILFDYVFRFQLEGIACKYTQSDLPLLASKEPYRCVDLL